MKERAPHAACKSITGGSSHALFAKEPIPIPCLLDSCVPEGTGIAIVEKPGIYRVELLGPAAIVGKPRTGVPIATVYSFLDMSSPCDVIAAEWAKKQLEYGAPGRAELPGRGFMAVIKHKYAKLDAQTGPAVTEICDFLGYAAFAHSTGNSPPEESRRSYLAAMASHDVAARKHVQGLVASYVRPAATAQAA